MRIIIGSAGTRSNLVFLFELGKRLQHRHHTVTMIVPEKYRSEIMKMELRMVTCGRSFDEYLEGNSSDTSTEFVKALASQVASQFVALRDALREADILISDIFLVPAASMAEKVGLPHFQLIQSPMLLDPESFPFIGVPYEKVSGLLGKRRKEILRKEWQEVLGSVLNREREFSHLNPIGDLYQHLMSAGHHLIAVDPEIVQLKQSPDQTIVGYFNSDYSPSNSNQPSIFFGKLPFPIAERESFLNSICETLDASGYQVVVPSDWYDSNAASFPRNCIAIDPAEQFGTLLQSAAVVHQGSAGFVMTCAREGIPQVVVPHLIENYFWAETVGSLKLGLEIKKRFDAKSIASAAMEAVQMRDQTQAFSEKLRSRDGIELCCDAIESL